MYHSTCVIHNNTNTKEPQQLMYVFNTLHMYCSTFLMYSENNYCVLSTLHMHCSTFVMYLVNKNRVLSTLHRYCSSLQMYCINFVMNCSTFVMYCSTRFWPILTENPFQRMVPYSGREERERKETKKPILKVGSRWDA